MAGNPLHERHFFQRLHLYDLDEDSVETITDKHELAYVEELSKISDSEKALRKILDGLSRPDPLLLLKELSAVAGLPEMKHQGGSVNQHNKKNKVVPTSFTANYDAVFKNIKLQMLNIPTNSSGKLGKHFIPVLVSDFFLKYIYWVGVEVIFGRNF